MEVTNLNLIFCVVLQEFFDNSVVSRLAAENLTLLQVRHYIEKLMPECFNGVPRKILENKPKVLTRVTMQHQCQ
jgi:hypothetical protein